MRRVRCIQKATRTDSKEHDDPQRVLEAFNRSGCCGMYSTCGNNPETVATRMADLVFSVCFSRCERQPESWPLSLQQLAQEWEIELNRHNDL